MMPLDTTFGAMYVGTAIATALYGLTTLQAYFYYLNYPEDTVGTKFLVLSIWILDTIHVVLINHSMYAYLVTDIFKPQLRMDGVWSLYASLLTNVIIAFIVQCFFTKRIHVLCKMRAKWWLTSLIAFFVFAHFCFGLETTAEFFIRKQFHKLQGVFYSAALPFAIVAILSDVLIAIALCTVLDTNRTDYEDTNNIINRLIVYSINRCILTSAVAIAEIVVFIRLPETFYVFAIDFVIGKLYANSFLATLNSRRSLRTRKSIHLSTSAETSTGIRLGSLNPASEAREEMIEEKPEQPV